MENLDLARAHRSEGLGLALQWARYWSTQRQTIQVEQWV
jgi:hypothetical protein